jgi:four helix bundle protein
MRHGFVSSAKDMDVFKRAYELSLKIHQASLGFPQREQYGLADQLRRSSKSICSNLIEGFAKQINSKREFARYVVISLGSCNEVLLWLRYAGDLGYLSLETSQTWQKEYDEIARMLNRLYKSISNISNN